MRKILLFPLALYIISCNSHKSCKDFHFIIKSGKDKYISKTQTFIKDMVSPGPDSLYTFKIGLDSTKLKKIQAGVDEINLWNYSDNYSVTTDGSGTQVFISPCFSYSIEIFCGNNSKKITWDNCHGIPEGKEFEKLQRLFDSILETIMNTPEYKASPEIKSFYL